MIFGAETSDLLFQNLILGPEFLSLPAKDDSAFRSESNRSATACVANWLDLFLLALIPFLVPFPQFVLTGYYSDRQEAQGTPLHLQKKGLAKHGFLLPSARMR